jgi:pimeloyl-ACP methyl ester carboxylesterase
VARLLSSATHGSHRNYHRLSHQILPPDAAHLCSARECQGEFLATTRSRHVGEDPNIDRHDPDLWNDEFYFLNRPGQADIQTELFYDYRNNVSSYPAWQTWLQKTQPRLLVLWGKYETSFDPSEPASYRRDVPSAQIHIVDGPHFAIDTAAEDIAEKIREFDR